jgi:hypothetical protein
VTTYSLAAYQLAVRFLRTKKTILVEGPTDKLVIARMMLERGTAAGQEFLCVVDESAMLNDPQMAGMGAKQKVEHIAGVIGGGNDTRFNWIVDREWEGVDISKPHEFATLAELPLGLRTKGHSIENYWLRTDALSKYLKFFFGDLLPVAFFNDLEVRFDSILRLAAAYSFCAKHSNIITRCSGAVCVQDVEWTGYEYVMLRSFSARMATRGASVDMTAEVNSRLQQDNLRASSRDVLQWMCHGHLGEEMTRVCAAHLAAEHGIQSQTVEQVERGRRTEKLMADADFLSSLEDGAVHPLGNLLAWAQ